jgi:hypothetical protein
VGYNQLYRVPLGHLGVVKVVGREGRVCDIHVVKLTSLLEKIIGFSPDKKWNHEQTTNQGSTF